MALTITFTIMAGCLVAEPAHARLKGSGYSNTWDLFTFSIDTSISDSILNNVNPDSIAGFTGDAEAAQNFIFWNVNPDDIVGKYVGAVQEAHLEGYIASTSVDIPFKNADLLVYKIDGGLRYEATLVDTNSKYPPRQFYFDILSTDPNLIKSLLDSLPSLETLSDPSIIRTRNDINNWRTIPARLVALSFFDLAPSESTRRSHLSFTSVPDPIQTVPEQGSPVSLLSFVALGAFWLLRQSQKRRKH
ncbi:hypothetical protein AB0758_48870 [Tolypothrix bouteillei VB521301_2]